jgi:hypothetical protein
VTGGVLPTPLRLSLTCGSAGGLWPSTLRFDSSLRWPLAVFDSPLAGTRRGRAAPAVGGGRGVGRSFMALGPSVRWGDGRGRSAGGKANSSAPSFPPRLCEKPHPPIFLLGAFCIIGSAPENPRTEPVYECLFLRLLLRTPSGVRFPRSRALRVRRCGRPCRWPLAVCAFGFESGLALAFGSRSGASR